MHGTKFPHNISKETDNVNRNFFWNNNFEHDHYQSLTSLTSWGKIRRAKREGFWALEKLEM